MLRVMRVRQRVGLFSGQPSGGSRAGRAVLGAAERGQVGSGSAAGRQRVGSGSAAGRAVLGAAERGQPSGGRSAAGQVGSGAGRQRGQPSGAAERGQNNFRNFP
jgi:hypothetical protein